MSLLEILKLVGFATGAAIHLYIAWLIWNRKLGSRQGLTQPERTFIVLGLCLGLWFLGNMFTSLHGLLLGAGRLSTWLKVWDTITMTGIALLPPALLHSHIAFWSYIDNYRFLRPRHVRLAAVALYAPLVGLIYAIYLIYAGDYSPFMIKLRPLLIPYSVWFLFALWASAVIDWAMKDRFKKWATRERVFFKRIAILLFVIGAVEFVVVGIRRSGPDDPLYVAYVLLSLLPTITIAYHVYRYKLVEGVIKSSLVYASFAIIFIAVYTYGIRNLDRFLVERYPVRPGVIEVILILGMVALAGPLVRVIDRMVHRLFAREIGIYRDVVRQVSAGAAGFGELDSLVRYTQEIIREGLELTSVRIVSSDRLMPGEADRRIADKMVAWKADVIEADEDLGRAGATAAYALRREETLVGLMLISAEPQTLTSEKRAILDVLAGQVAVEVESCRLVEEKVRLERELSNRERLATLGQMAATVAHEVKNPLSAIKSIAQVMREEAPLAQYDRDLGMIISEIDRLNRTVSQLLAFSRPGRADARPALLSELIDSTVALFGIEAKERGVEVIAESPRGVSLDGAQAAALGEAIGNLVLNAIQATERGGKVLIEAARPSTSKLVVSITDTGPGIPAEAQRRVFEPFYTTKSRGTGLGLAIVQRRAAELGGLVDLTSPVREGRGTMFRLVVPLSSKGGPEPPGAGSGA